MTWLQAGDDHLSVLFDMAQNASDDDLFALSAITRNDVLEIRHLLDIVDAAWQAPEAAINRVHALFLRKLSATDPNHPWVQGNLVRTLGELIQVGDERPGSLSEEFYKQASEDSTPVESLLDPVLRNRVVGQLVQRADLSVKNINDFVLWLSKLVANLSPSEGQSNQGLIFTRRQGSRNKGNQRND